MPTLTPPQLALSPIIAIDKRSRISRKELVNEYIKPGIPVVLTDAAAHWPAMGKFTPDFFKANYGQLTKEIKGQTYTMAEIVDLIQQPVPGTPVPYPFCLDMEVAFPELLQEVKPEIDLGMPNRTLHPLLSRMLLKNTVAYEIFLGGKGSRFPYLHIDALYLHTQITQLYGAKDFILYSPNQAAYLYPTASNPKVSAVDAFRPDYEKHPLFQYAQPVRVTVEQGESILFPTGWWHTTEIDGPCISMGRTYLNEWNWNDFVADNFELRKKTYPLLAYAMRTYAQALGHVLNAQEKITARV